MAITNCERIYKALVEGAYDGLAGDELLAAINERCPHADAASVAQATLLALSDADIVDPLVLRAVCDLALAGSSKAA